MKSDVEIAQEAQMKPISQIAAEIGLNELIIYWQPSLTTICIMVMS